MTISKPQSSKNGNIIFFEQDDPRSKEALRGAIEPVTIPIMGLILKVKEGEHGEEIVNWMFADANFIKSLALTLLGDIGSQEPIFQSRGNQP